MFEQAFIDAGVRTRQPWTMPVSATGQAVAIGAIVLATLMHTEALPQARRIYVMECSPRPVTQVATRNPSGGAPVAISKATRCFTRKILLRGRRRPSMLSSTTRP